MLHLACGSSRRTLPAVAKYDLHCGLRIFIMYESLLAQAGIKPPGELCPAIHLGTLVSEFSIWQPEHQKEPSAMHQILIHEVMGNVTELYDKGE